MTVREATATARKRTARREIAGIVTTAVTTVVTTVVTDGATDGTTATAATGVGMVATGVERGIGTARTATTATTGDGSEEALVDGAPAVVEM